MNFWYVALYFVAGLVYGICGAFGIFIYYAKIYGIIPVEKAVDTMEEGSWINTPIVLIAWPYKLTRNLMHAFREIGEYLSESNYKPLN